MRKPSSLREPSGLVARWSCSTGSSESLTARSPECFCSSSAGDPWLYYYLVRREDLASVEMLFVEGQSRWRVDIEKSPEIEYTRCYIDENINRQGGSSSLTSMLMPAVGGRANHRTLLGGLSLSCLLCDDRFKDALRRTWVRGSMRGLPFQGESS